MRETDAAAAASLQEISKRFADGTLALDAFTVGVWPGEVVCLLGGPRSGKSVVLRLVAGVLTPTVGTVQIGGRPAANSLDALRQVTYVSSRAAHAPSLNAAQNLQCYTALSGLACSDAECVQALREAGLPEFALSAPTSTLGAEHRLLIWLAAASLRKAPVLLLDDPSEGLDPGAITRLQRWLAGRRSAGTAIMLATSDPLLASQADRIVFLVEGRKVSEKTRHEFTAQTLMGLYLELLGHR
jgi:ABC-2 type transport system ATP-binding protein